MNHILSFLAACFVGAATVTGSSVVAKAEESARVGVILPLTGEAAFWGENSRRGIELALKDLKEREGLAAPEVIFEDDHCNPKDAVTAFRKLVEVDNVNIILGPACSSSSVAVQPLAEEKRVLVLAFSESDAIKAGNYVFLLWVPNGMQGRRLAQYVANEWKLRSVAVLSIQNAFGLALTKAFKEEFIRLGGVIAADEEYAPESTSMRSELLRISAKHPQGLLIGSYIKDGQIIVREASQLRLNMQLLGPSTINAPEFFAATKSLAEGLVLADLPDSSTEEFRARWTRDFGGQYPGMQSGAPLFYDITTILGHWLKDHRSDGTLFRDYLRTVDYRQGVSGGIRFTSGGYLDRIHALFVVRNGRLEPLR